MNFKKGDVVMVRDNETTKILAERGLIKIGSVGVVINEAGQIFGDKAYLVEFEDKSVFNDGQAYVYGSWLEPFELPKKSFDVKTGLKDILSPTIDDIENKGVEITIKYDGNTLDVEIDDDYFDFDDIDDNGVAMLYNTVDTLYRVLGVEVDD